MEKMFYLKTIGAGTQNLIRIFLMLSCNVFSSRYQEVWSTADAPAVGSGAPHTEFMAEGWDPSNSSSNLKKIYVIISIMKDFLVTSSGF